jgi:hypothetical protein
MRQTEVEPVELAVASSAEARTVLPYSEAVAAKMLAAPDNPDLPPSVEADTRLGLHPVAVDLRMDSLADT